MVGKIELMGPGGILVFDITGIINYSCTRVLLYVKMLKETERKTFCHIVFIDVISIGGGPFGPDPPAYACDFNTTCDIMCAFLP